MKFVAAFLIATVLVSAVMCAEEAPAKPSKQAIKDALITKAKELKAKIAAAIKPGKSKAEEVIKQLGPTKEQALAKLTEMKAQLQAKLKEVVIPAYGKAKQHAAMKLKAQLAKAIKNLEAAKAKLEKLQ
ncbi:hypothetical protein GE061_002199 [Apolygus lucorum]|uniref:Uncharacterized protein n=1 Tax=Apolygus lucorum TaxID=248454 RepID=A0A8S9X5U3_APOLU|nr:hypothetical protein GE061_002199 [Apolygus lucorum]